MQRDRKYYDIIYQNSVKYSVNYKESNYYEVWKKVIEWLKEGDSIIDLGCGTGQFAQMVKDNLKVNYIGVDFSGEAARMARGLNTGYKFRWMDIFDYMKEPDYYDVVIMLELLEHIEDDRELLSKIKKGKRVIFSVPSFDSASHLRTYKDADSIYDRYGDIIKITEMYQITYTETRYITLLYGKR